MTTKQQAYRALQSAAEQIGRNNYRAGLYKTTYRYPKRGPAIVVKGYTITREHRQIVDAMPAVLAEKITPDEAMALLHEPEVFRQRFPE